jgi:hypothetical protein
VTRIPDEAFRNAKAREAANVRQTVRVQNHIPARIIQTGKSAKLPLKDRASVCNVRLLNPDFEYLFFDDEQVESFVDDHFPQYRRVFDAFPFRIQRYDFFRYLAVYHFGGFYFDLDVFLASPLNALQEYGCVFPFEGLTFSRYLRSRGMDWQVGNYAFGACAAHPFLAAVIQNCVRAQKDPAWVHAMMAGVPALSRSDFLVLNSTGPGLLSRTLVEEREIGRTVTVLFPEDVCDVRGWNLFGEIGVHLMNGSWRNEKHFLIRRLAQYVEVAKMRSLLTESRQFGSSRSVETMLSSPSVPLA